MIGLRPDELDWHWRPTKRWAERSAEAAIRRALRAERREAEQVRVTYDPKEHDDQLTAILCPHKRVIAWKGRSRSEIPQVLPGIEGCSECDPDAIELALRYEPKEHT